MKHDYDLAHVRYNVCSTYARTHHFSRGVLVVFPTKKIPSCATLLTGTFDFFSCVLICADKKKSMLQAIQYKID